MYSQGLAVVALAAALVPLTDGTAALAADDGATLLRVFLRDGTSLVSYGEPARVGDRIVFSMPTAASPNPPLHLINLSADRVDWERTERYSNAARAAQYVKSQAELDYAALSSQLADALNAVAGTTDQAERLRIVERARGVLADWPQQHYNYRQAEVRQMVGMLDEAIVDLRAASGARQFDLSLTAFSEPPVITEALFPPLTLQQSIEQVLIAARAVDSSIERTSLLSTALSTLDRERDSLPADWVSTTRPAIEAAISAELRIDQSYRLLTERIVAAADRRARAADVRSVENLLLRVRQRDRELGGVRPEAVSALIAAVEDKLDAARRLRLARDRWELRLPALAEYGTSIRAPIALFGELAPALENIKSLAGSPPSMLATLERGTARLVELMTNIVPPEELVASHALMKSAAEMAANAVSVRRDAILANDMNRAWNASSAAAGALMLGAKARADILALLSPPKLR
jgi:hypothetical protein